MRKQIPYLYISLRNEGRIPEIELYKGVSQRILISSSINYLYDIALENVILILNPTNILEISGTRIYYEHVADWDKERIFNKTAAEQVFELPLTYTRKRLKIFGREEEILKSGTYRLKYKLPFTKFINNGKE
jgi:hypothetical protein